MHFLSYQLIKAQWRKYGSAKWVSIDSDNGLSPVMYQAFVWTGDGLFNGHALMQLY